MSSKAPRQTANSTRVDVRPESLVEDDVDGAVEPAAAVRSEQRGVPTMERSGGRMVATKG
jgi:hypothetical protein